MGKEDQNRIGMGVDLVDGPETLSELKLIRAEFQAIVALSQNIRTPPRSRSGGSGGRASSDPYNPSNPDQLRLFSEGLSKQNTLFSQSEIEKTRILGGEIRKRGQLKTQEEREEERRQQRMRADYVKTQRENEVIRGTRVAERNTKETERENRLMEARFLVHERINERGARAAADRLQKDQQGLAILKEEQALYAEINRANAINRAQKLAVLDKEAKALGLNTRNLNTIGDFQNAIGSRQQLIEQNRARAAARQQEVVSHAADPGIPIYSQSSIREARTDYRAARGTSQISQEARDDLAFTLRVQRAKVAEQRRADRERVESVEAANARIKADVQSLFNFEEKTAVKRAGLWRISQPPGGGGPGGGGGGGGPRGGFTDPKLFNEKGFFTSVDIIGRITRNILLYQVVSQSTYGLVDYIQTAVQAAKKTDDLGRAMEFATEKAGGNYQANLQLVESLRSFGLSRQQGITAVTEAERFSEVRPAGSRDRSSELVNVVTNIAASRGEGIDKVGDVIEQLRRRESKFYKRIFGTTIEEVYREAGEKAVLPTRGLEIVDKKKDVRTDKEAVNDYVAALTEAQKEQIAYNYILSQAPRFQGEAAKRSEELSGRMDTVASRFADAKEGVGQFITEIKFLNTFLESSIGFFDRLTFSTSKLKGSGQGGAITGYDVERFVSDKTNSTRATALSAINDYAGPVATGILGVGALSLIGRRNARQQYRTSVYDQNYQQGLVDFEGDAKVAASRAKSVAQDAKPGLLRSVDAGVRRITVGLQESVLDLTSAVANRIGANGIASKADVLKATGRPYITANFAETTASGVQRSLANQQYFDNRLAQSDAIESGRARGGQVGGLAGGLFGFEIGSLIARSINAGPIVATTLTILGGVAGSAVGTSVGSAIGGSIAGGALGAISVAGAVVAGSILAVGLAIIAVTDRMRTGADAELARIEARNIALNQQALQEIEAKKEGRLFYRSLNKEDGVNRLFTQAEYEERQRQGRGLGFVKVIRTAEEIKSETDIRKNINTLGVGTGDEILKARGREYDIDVERRQRQKEEQEKQGRINDQARALARLRETAEGSFKFVGEIGEAYAGPDNPFVKIFADGATAAQRMEAQWGFLGEATAKYFTELENRKNSILEIGAAFQSLNTQQDFYNKAARERTDREGPGSSRRQTEGRNIGEAILNSIAVGASTASRERELTDPRFALDDAIERYLERPRPQLTSRQTEKLTPRQKKALENENERYEQFQINNNQRQYARRIEEEQEQARVATEAVKEIRYRTSSFRSYGADEGGIQEIVTQAIETQLQGLSSRQIRQSPFLTQTALEVTRSQREIAERRTNDEISKARLSARDDTIVQANLEQANQLRSRLIGQGRDPVKVGEALDKFIISRTDNIAVKDLTFNQFQQRQDALKRSAEAEVRKEAEARAAVEKGLAYQKVIAETLLALRADIIGGNASVIIQVLNDSLARIDQEALQDNNTGFKVPRLDNSYKTNPYSDLNNRYGRGGRKN